MSYLQLLPLDLHDLILKYVHNTNVRLKLYEIKEHPDWRGNGTERTYYFKLFISYGKLSFNADIGFLLEGDMPKYRDKFEKDVNMGKISPRFCSSPYIFNLIHYDDKYLIQENYTNICITKEIYDKIIQEFRDVFNSKLSELKVKVKVIDNKNDIHYQY